MATKRAKSKAFISDSDSDSEGGKKTKKEKPRKQKKEASSEEGEEETSWELGKKKKVTVKEYKGMKLIDIREFYEDKSSGEERPGRKGISLQVAQWDQLTQIVDKVNKALGK